MKINSKIKIPHLFVFIVFCLTFNAVKYWPLFGITSICYAMGIILPFIICPSFYGTKQLLWFLLYAVVVSLNFLTGDVYMDNTNSLMIGFVGFYVSMAMSYYVFTRNDISLMRAIVYTVCVVIIWTTVVTAIYDRMFPGMVRMLYGVAVKGLEAKVDLGSFKKYYAMGLSSYAMPHAIPVLIPAFVMGVKNSSLDKKQRVLSAIMLLCCLMLVYFSGATGPVLVSFMVLLISLIIRRGSLVLNVFVFIIVFLLIMPFVMDDQFLLAALEWIDGLVGGEGYFHYKIIDFEESIIYEENAGDVAAREELYGQTIGLIFDNVKNLFIGVQEGHGGHSALMDRFASLGLVGFIPLMAVLVSQAKFLVKQLPANTRMYYYTSILAAMMMLLSKNVTGWTMWFFLFAALPFYLVYFSNSYFANKRI